MSITSGWRRLGYKIELPRLLKLEKQIANKSAGMFLFNQVESAYFDCPNVYTVPHGVNQELFSVKSVASDYSDGVSLIGKMDILHNRDMVRWFASEVMPLLPSTIKFYIIGAHPTKEILNLSIADPRIIVKGFMENPYPVIRSSIACICPMQTGGGIQNKIIEAMAVGALVVSSPRAMLPLKEPEDSGILICSKSSEWANQIMDICKTPENYLANRSMARRYAKKHFSWDSFGNEILEVINKSVSYK